MANPPAVQNKSSSELSAPELAVVELLAKGKSPAEIAKIMYPEDKKRRKAMRAKLWRMVRSDARVAQALGERAQGQMLLDLVPATTALGRRAKKGRPDAIKLLFEASGFHNPKVKHEHSGDIKVVLDMPRPARVETSDANDDEVTDAEVVAEEDA